MGKLRNINRRVYPKTVAIINGAPAALVSMRYLRGDNVTTGKAKETNRHIKYYATWFLLKALTTTSYIQQWTSQKNYLLHWCQMNENTFRHHLAWLQQELLLEVDKHSKSIRLCGYEAAAEHMGLDEYTGTYSVAFNPNKHNGKQTFQYLLRMEEFEHHKQRQLEALTYKLDKNPELRNDLLYHLVQLGADHQRLYTDPAYYAGRLLRLQIKLFREGSEILTYITQLRADINRGVRKIKKHHAYRSAQSVSYMKRRMFDMGFARIWKVAIQSEARSRLYVPADEDTPPGKVHNGMRDGYKYVRGSKATVWFLCDQVARLYAVKQLVTNLKSSKNAA